MKSQLETKRTEENQLLIQPAISTTLFVRSGRKFIKMELKEIIYLESVGNYSKFHLDVCTYLSLISIKRLGQLLPNSLFFKLNRGIILNKLHLLSFDRDNVRLSNGIRLSFGEGRYRALISELPII